MRHLFLAAHSFFIDIVKFHTKAWYSRTKIEQEEDHGNPIKVSDSMYVFINGKQYQFK